MKAAIKYISLLLVILISSCTSKQYGKAIIALQPEYEEGNMYFQHDYFMKSDMLDTALVVKRQQNSLIVHNVYNDGFMGHSITLRLNPNLEIKEAKYKEWTDVVDGSQIDYSVEKVILSLSANPFTKESLTGHYTLQLRQEYKAGKLLRSESVSDTTSYRIFNGKFKIYSQGEIEKGRDWIIDQNEIRNGIKDSSGVYLSPDTFAEYEPGQEALEKLIKKFEIDKDQVNGKKKGFVILTMVVDADGTVNPETLSVIEPIKSNELLNKLKSNKDLLTNWLPAIYKGNRVKSLVNLPIRIEE